MTSLFQLGAGLLTQTDLSPAWGVGGSGVPRPGRAYSTAIMARDVLAVMDHIGWSAPVHVVGHSMGAMVATKLAAAAPHRVASLTLISATGGGWAASQPVT